MYFGGIQSVFVKYFHIRFLTKYSNDSYFPISPPRKNVIFVLFMFYDIFVFVITFVYI